MLDYHGDDIVFPSNFVVDLNYSTIKMMQCVDLQFKDGINIKNCINTHIINGKIYGNYENFDFETAKELQGIEIPAEGLSITTMHSSLYCSYDNVEVAYNTGYNFNIGRDTNNDTYTSASWDFSNNVAIRYGKEVTCEGMITSGYVPISVFNSRKEFQISKAFGYGKYIGIAEMFVHFYSDSKYLCTIKTRQFQRIKIPTDKATKIRITCFSIDDNSVYNELRAHYVGKCINCALNNIYAHDTRTTTLTPTHVNNLVVDNFVYDRISLEKKYHVTPILADFEDGWENALNVFIENMRPRKKKYVGGSVGSDSFCIHALYNIVIDNCKFKLYSLKRVKGLLMKNSQQTGLYSVNSTSDKNNQSHIMFYNTKVDGWEFGNPIEGDGNLKFENCRIGQDFNEERAEKTNCSIGW